uniref:Uncharacterized protein n=1 Tax=Caenorhabditis tropicalis TaxID=1561998 RepID=A0A1I7URZ7_9PELO
MSRTVNYDPEDDLSRRIYSYRCDKIVSDLCESVIRFKRLSDEHNKTFFAVPFKWTRKLLRKSARVQRALRRQVEQITYNHLINCFTQHVNYPKLRRKWARFLELKKKRFNPIADVAYRELNFGGFTTCNMLITVALWNMYHLREYPQRMNYTVNFPPPSSIQHQMFMKPFAILDVDIFGPISENWRQRFDDANYDLLEPDQVDADQRATLHLTPPPGRIGPASPDRRADSGYKGIEEADFEEFERISANKPWLK